MKTLALRIRFLAYICRKIPNKALRNGLGWRIDRYLESHEGYANIRCMFGNTFRLDMPDIVSQYLFKFGFWEPSLTQFLKSVLRPGDILVDVGSNIGYFALAAARLVGPTGKVHAIEASPSIFERLQSNIRVSGVSNITCYNNAALDGDGEVTIYLEMGVNKGGSTIMSSELGARQLSAEAKVQGRALPDLIPEVDFKAVKVIKIDVEGAEALVINGLLPRLKDLPSYCYIVLELSRSALARSGKSVAGVLADLGTAGFIAYDLHNEYNNSYYADYDWSALKPLNRFTDHGEGDLLDLVFMRGR
jgi:FkbM family methyltransferase